MTGARDGIAEADLLRHGAARLAPPRQAKVGRPHAPQAAGNPPRGAWISRMPRPGAAVGGTPAARADATRMLTALRANAAVAQRATAAAQRGLSALLAPSDPVYEADGRTSPAPRRGKPLSA